MRKPSLTERASGARSAQDMRKRNGAGAGCRSPARSFKRISYKKRILINKSGSDSSTCAEPNHIIPRISVRFAKKTKCTRPPFIILHAMDRKCWNPHARKSAQGRSARGPILPKSNRNFRQPPRVFICLCWKLSEFTLVRPSFRLCHPGGCFFCCLLQSHSLVGLLLFQNWNAFGGLWFLLFFWTGTHQREPWRIKRHIWNFRFESGLPPSPSSP